MMKECAFIGKNLICIGCVNNEHIKSEWWFVWEKKKLLMLYQSANRDPSDHPSCSCSAIQPEERFTRGDSNLNDSKTKFIITKRSTDWLKRIEKSRVISLLSFKRRIKNWRKLFNSELQKKWDSNIFMTPSTNLHFKVPNHSHHQFIKQKTVWWWQLIVLLTDVILFLEYQFYSTVFGL